MINWRWKLVERNKVEILENTIKEYKKTVESRERSIKELIGRVDEVKEEYNDYKEDQPFYK